jgi:hypothetical protein
MVFRMTRPYGLSSAHRTRRLFAGAADVRDVGGSAIEGHDDREGERAAAARPALHHEPAAHRLGEPLDQHQAEAETAKSSPDRLVRLRERTKQQPDLRRRHTDAIVDHRERQPHAVAAGARRGHAQHDVAALGELHGIVDQVLHRGAQAHRIADHVCGDGSGDMGLATEALGLRARRARGGERLRERTRIEALAPQGEAAHARASGIDHHGGQRDEMLGRFLERRDPASLALAEFGGRQEFADRDDAGERRADVVREAGERNLERARRRSAAPRFPPGLSSAVDALRHHPLPACSIA